MIIPLAQSTSAEGSAAAETAKLFGKTNVEGGYVLQTTAMTHTLDMRAEQIESLLKVRTRENAEDVAGDLKDIILTLHVPKVVEKEVEQSFELVQKPALIRLSPVGKVADVLEPTMIIGLEDGKSLLDGLRMLYAQMYTAPNLATEDDNRQAAVIIQHMPNTLVSFRSFHAGEHTVIEAQGGYGAWVGYGEPDRFLFEGDELKKTERGSTMGVVLENGIREKAVQSVSEADAKAAYALAKELRAHTEASLLLGKDVSGKLFVLGCLPH